MNSLNGAKSTENHQPKKHKTKLRWFEQPMTADCFTTKTDRDGKFYAQHNAWKKTIWIGPYNSEEELNKIIKKYIANSKKKPMERLWIEGLHSIIMKDKDW